MLKVIQPTSHPSTSGNDVITAMTNVFITESIPLIVQPRELIYNGETEYYHFGNFYSLVDIETQALGPDSIWDIPRFGAQPKGQLLAEWLMQTHLPALKYNMAQIFINLHFWVSLVTTEQIEMMCYFTNMLPNGTTLGVQFIVLIPIGTPVGDYFTSTPILSGPLPFDQSASVVHARFLSAEQLRLNNVWLCGGTLQVQQTIPIV